ncbi:MAG: STN domain-containing protein [Candidatus Xenobiia bacterium LiM19]
MIAYRLFNIFFIIAFLLISLSLSSQAAAPDKIITSIQIENAGSLVKVHITSSQTLTWKMIRRDGGASPALTLLISPVDPDPEAPKEIPVNAGLIKKVRFSHLNDKDKSLIVTVDVVSTPQYSLQERPDKKGLTLVMNREIMLGKKVPKTAAAMTRRTGTRLENAFTVFFDSGKSPTVKSPEKPLTIRTEQEHALIEGRELKKNLSLIMTASKAGSSSKSRMAGESSQGGKEILNTEFKDTELVKMLKFIAEKMGLNLVTSPQVKGSKSIVVADMTPEEALPLILKGTGFWYRIDRQILFVGPPAILGAFSPEATVSEKEEVTRIVVLKNSRIEPLVPALIRKFPEATFTPHSSLNAIVITAPASLFEKIEEVISEHEKNAPAPPPAKDRSKEEPSR